MKVSFLKNAKISTKLIALALGVCLVSVSVIGFLSFRASARSLLVQSEQTLDGIRTTRSNHIEHYFSIIREQIHTFAMDDMVINATAQFSQCFHQLPDEIDLEQSREQVVRDVTSYYETEFRSRVVSAGGTWRGAQYYVPRSDAGLTAQWLYIATNPNPVGSKLDLNASSIDSGYNEWHAHFHPVIREYLKSFEYYDIFLFDTEGNLVYSVFKETDYATNFLDGSYASTNFGRVVKETLTQLAKGEVSIVDFEPYEPSYGSPAAFIGSPVFLDGQRIGAVVFQMPVDRVNAIMTDGSGLGASGQTYLLGPDQRMRSTDRFSQDSTIFVRDVNTAASNASAKGNIGHMRSMSLGGNPALASFSPVKVEGFDWSIIAEKDMSEVTAASNALGKQIVLFSVIVAIAVCPVVWLVSRTLTKPIRSAVSTIENIVATNDLTARLQDDRKDEMGVLAQSLNNMFAKIHDIICEVRTAALDVTSGATQIASSSQSITSDMLDQERQTARASAAIEQMSASVTEISSMASNVSSLSENASSYASEGGRVVAQTIEGMKSINVFVNQTSDTVGSLGERSDQIGEVISVINDIADQTNLLALNAAIEAARAGENGRGFAVVAEEVRKLAERTSSATEEVATSINAIRQETVAAVKRMKEGKTRVDEGVCMADQAGEALREIVNSSSEVASGIRSIAATAEEQSAASADITQTIESINRITSSSTRGIEQASAAATMLCERAERLQQHVNQFKLMT